MAKDYKQRINASWDAEWLNYDTNQRPLEIDWAGPHRNIGTLGESLTWYIKLFIKIINYAWFLSILHHRVPNEYI